MYRAALVVTCSGTWNQLAHSQDTSGDGTVCKRGGSRTLSPHSLYTIGEQPVMPLIKALSKKAAIEQKKAADCLSSVILVALVVYNMTVEILKEHPRKIINRN
jgi:hypothetical protein